MAEKTTPAGVIFGAGAFVGLLLGVVLTYVSIDRASPGGGGAKPAVPGVPAQAGGGADPHAGGGDPHGANPHGGGGADRAEQSFAKIHFMKKFVAALSDLPENMTPTPDYAPLLKEGAQPLVCADCHDPSKIDMERMIAQDPGYDEVAKFRRQPRFMIPLMENWVERLNKMHGDRLRKPVTCTDCHSVDPHDFENYIQERLRVFPPLMSSFTAALTSPPTNRNPAKDWKPLLKDPKAGGVTCATCHGEVGRNLMAGIESGQIALEDPEDFASNKEYMVRLMEHWVERLNRAAGPLLTKAVGCKDCHDTDPRR